MDVICITIKVNRVTIVQNRIAGGFQDYMTFREYLNMIINEWNIEHETNPIKSVNVEIEDDSKRLFNVSENETLERVRYITKGIFVKYIIEKEEESDVEVIEQPVPINAFNVIMTGKIRELEPITAITAIGFPYEISPVITNAHSFCWGCEHFSRMNISHLIMNAYSFCLECKRCFLV